MKKKTVLFTQNEAACQFFEKKKIVRLMVSYEMVGWKVLEKPVLRKPRPLEFGIGKGETGMRESRDRQIFLLKHPHLHMM